jgi:hypothetical protein
MSSVLRTLKEPTHLNRQFMVHTYRGFSDNDYFFTVEGNKLYRIENDLSGVDWVVARDMGVQRVITDIDTELLELWESNNGWTNIHVIRPGVARKFQALAMVQGNTDISSENGPAWNAGAYLRTDNTPIYNYQTNTVNDMMVLGHESTTVSNNYNQNLPFGTFWAMNDPVVIEYVFSEITYRRAIKHRIDETTLF